MPNWCDNYVKITGPEEKIKAIAEAVEKGEFLNTLYPEPDYKKTPVAKTFPEIKAKFAKTDEEREKALKNEPVISDSSWWDWRVQNWGTKWELQDVPKEAVKVEETTLSFPFFSAWSPPIGALQHYTEDNPDCLAELHYSEPGCDFCGCYDSEMGDICMSISETDREFFKTDPLGKELDDLFAITEMLEEYEEEENA